jgi:XTP/dITP diphosphohydrolase
MKKTWSSSWTPCADVPDAQRGCHFACVMLAATPGGLELIGRGAWQGRVTHAPAGTGGFGYDPYFLTRNCD